jgi:hypothetical protein
MSARTISLAVTSLAIWGLAVTPAGARTTTALSVQPITAPQHVQGSDGREHVEYDLVITDVFGAEATLRSLEVRGDGRLLLTLKDKALAAVTRRLFSPDPTTSIAPASTVVTQVDLVLPRSSGRTTPKRLTNRIKYAIPADAPGRSLIDSTTADSPVLLVDRRDPIVISSPLRGSGWLSVNGCCGDPTSPHRSTVLSDGTYVAPETFAIDWIRVVGGVVFTGDGKRNTDWPTYRAPLYAVADGTVVSTVDGKPEIPPFQSNPGLRTPFDYPGNNVILKIGPSAYAVYAHLVPGSVRVKRGQRVRTGQVLGLLGNSGNTDAPHLHFGIQRGPFALSASLPFEIDDFTLEGDADPAGTAPVVTPIGKPRPARRAHPLFNSITTLTPGSAGRGAASTTRP